MITGRWVKPYDFPGIQVCTLAPLCHESATHVAAIVYSVNGKERTMRKPACGPHAGKFEEKFGLREKNQAVAS